MALTLADFSMQAYNSGNLLLGNIADYFLMESNVLQLIPWATDKHLAVQIISIQTLPTVGTRKINAAYSESTGQFEQKIESKYIFGHEIDVDVVLAKAGDTIGDVRQNQRMMSAKGMSFKFNDMFINGDPASDEFKGIRPRIDDIYDMGGLYTEQFFSGASATTGRGILYDTTERHLFLDNMGKLIHVTAGHKPDAFYMNSKAYLAFESVLRRAGVMNQAQDMFGRIINTYQGVPLIDIGIKADQSTEIILNSETVAGVASGGTADTYTSIYAVKYGEGEYFWGIQQSPMEVRDLGEIDSKPVFRDRVEWVVGLAVSNPKSLTRMYALIPDSSES